LTIDDALMRDLRRAARTAGVSLKEMVNRALRSGLQRLEEKPRKRRYRCPTHSMGAPHVALDKALMLAGILESEEVARKIDLRK
jgi:hypothetical protein